MIVVILWSDLQLSDVTQQQLPNIRLLDNNKVKEQTQGEQLWKGAFPISMIKQLLLISVLHCAAAAPAPQDEDLPPMPVDSVASFKRHTS